MNTLTRLRTPVWLLMGLIGSAPGVLELTQGTLSLTVQGAGVLGKRQRRRLEARTGQPGLAERLARGETSQLFCQPLAQLERITFPWYYFGGGVVLDVAGARYRLSFVQPQNTAVGVGSLGDGIRAGKRWKAALGQ